MRHTYILQKAGLFMVRVTPNLRRQHDLLEKHISAVTKTTLKLKIVFCELGGQKKGQSGGLDFFFPNSIST